MLKKNPTVLIIYKEELSSYILFFNSMILIQEVFFVYSRNEIANDSKVRQNSANTQTIANTILLFRHYAFYLRGNCAIIRAGKMCSTEVGKKSLMSRPKIRGLNFFEKGSYTAKNPEFSIL